MEIKLNRLYPRINFNFGQTAEAELEISILHLMFPSLAAKRPGVLVKPQRQRRLRGSPAIFQERPNSVRGSRRRPMTSWTLVRLVRGSNGRGDCEEADSCVAEWRRTTTATIGGGVTMSLASLTAPF